MESAMLAGLLARPIALVVLFGIAFIAVAAGGSTNPTGLSSVRLLCGLVGVAIAVALAAAVSSYASPEQARQFGVSDEHRWSAIWSQFVVLSVLGLYVAVLGTSFVGIPLALFMARRGLATIPWYVLASLPVSLVLATPLVTLANSPHWASDVVFFVGSHAWLAFGFAFGAQLPWRATSAGANAA